MRDLFLFTIGPVKEFIESSRKLMDLYAGSRMLSELMRDSVYRLEVEENVKILFPRISDSHKDEPVNIPNRIVAEFTGNSEKRKLETARALTAFVKKKFCEMSLSLLKQAQIPPRGIELAQKQWEDFLEIYWVFQKYEACEYSEAYQSLLCTMYEVKGIRPFSQIIEPEGRKCILFPKYNAIFVKHWEEKGKVRYPYQTNSRYMCDITENHYLSYVVKRKEALSSIALVKRIYGKIATDLYSLRYMLLKRWVPEALFMEAGVNSLENEQRDMLADAVYDLANGQILDEEDYPLVIIENARHFYELIQKNDVKLRTYYAVIKFDGDNMGEAFKNLRTVDEQQALSDHISSFAYEVPGIIERFGGLPVFAGGEDFLGFIPMDCLFECVSVLRERFYHFIKRSFSIGIAIAHLMQPLKEVMACVDSMEASAKSVPGKNSFAISIIKRSGAHVIMPAYKLVDEEPVPQWSDLGELVRILSSTQCSKSMFFNISETMKYFSEEQVKMRDDMAEVLLRNGVNRAVMDDKRIDKEMVIGKLLLFYKHADHMADFLQTLSGIVFLAREVDG